MNNVVIEVLNLEHGQEVRKYWENKRFEAGDYNFEFNKEDGNEYRYYGVLNNNFGAWSLVAIKAREAEIIELPEEETPEQLPIPRMVLVRDSLKETWKKRELLADLQRFNIHNPFTCRDDEDPKTTEDFVYMKELPKEITKEEAEKILSELQGEEIKIK